MTAPNHPRAADPAAGKDILIIGGREPESIVDGPGFRYTVFVQGCALACPGCHNPQLQAFTGGTPVSVKEILAEIGANPLLSGLTLSGGEPFTQAGPCAALARGVREMGLTVVTYTGLTWEKIIVSGREDWAGLAAATDILVDGPFIRELRNIDLRFRGSSNQRLIDVRQSMASGVAVTFPE
ncbi:4Fe-4S single cluster domain-containing protein [Breznakiella homolactica]|uniref:Anaerobic ribonucleoside-triphosphate reductase-activating protein n=1 Tax=Breznakiella homolactica TaxID=2798577 RepID=A0A7T8B9U9_9SPIR|nr:4Fe-4S single cluster domain-containing protein [Breznakiella homolactica]QQO08691.1 radical SAM protein [Breznakiella homolactica]